jgi:hypothetical protein
MPARRRLVVPAAVVAVAAALAAGTLAVTGDPDGTGSELPARPPRAVAENRTDPEAWAALGAALESDGNYALSAEAYRLAADLQLYWPAYPQRLRSHKYWDRVRGCGGRAHVALDFGETHPPEDFANAAAGTPEFE